jgi:hypothetical protein
MNEIDTISLCIIAAGILALVVIRRSGVSERYRDASPMQGSLGQRLGAKYFRDRSWSEIAVLAAAPILWIAIIYLWGWWHGW